MTYPEMFRQIQNDPSASYWLKDALHALDKRDIVDASNDVELLLQLMQKRVDELLGS